MFEKNRKFKVVSMFVIAIVLAISLWYVFRLRFPDTRLKGEGALGRKGLPPFGSGPYPDLAVCTITIDMIDPTSQGFGDYDTECYLLLSKNATDYQAFVDDYGQVSVPVGLSFTDEEVVKYDGQFVVFQDYFGITHYGVYGHIYKM